MFPAKSVAQLEQFHAGEPVIVLYQGKYDGMLGKFLGVREDPNWADIEEAEGIVRSHPMEWIRRIDYRFDRADSGPSHLLPAADPFAPETIA